MWIDGENYRLTGNARLKWVQLFGALSDVEIIRRAMVSPYAVWQRKPNGDGYLLMYVRAVPAHVGRIDRVDSIDQTLLAINEEVIDLALIGKMLDAWKCHTPQVDEAYRIAAAIFAKAYKRSRNGQKAVDRYMHSFIKVGPFTVTVFFGLLYALMVLNNSGVRIGDDVFRYKAGPCRFERERNYVQLYTVDKQGGRIDLEALA